MGYWIVEAKNGALRGVRSELPGDRLSLPAVILHLEVLGSPTGEAPRGGSLPFPDIPRIGAKRGRRGKPASVPARRADQPDIRISS
jgi:hypothetical protein